MGGRNRATSQFDDVARPWKKPGRDLEGSVTFWKQTRVRGFTFGGSKNQTRVVAFLWGAARNRLKDAFWPRQFAGEAACSLLLALRLLGM